MITILISKLKLRTLTMVSAALTLALAACGGQSGVDDDGMHVVATTSVWGDVISQVAGDDATVEVLIPVGADAHDYQATSRQVAALQEADLVVANGLGLEEGLADVLEAAAADGANVLEVAPELDPLPFADHSHENEEDAGEHADGDLDPHVWFDPERVGTAARLIADQLAAIDDTVDWAARADAYADDLLQADNEIANTFDGIASTDRKLVTNHDSLGYLADRYGFEVIGVVIPGGSTLGEPSSAEMADLVEEIEHEGVDTLFAETSGTSRLTDAIASEVGTEVAVVELYSGSLGEPGSEAGTLIEMLTSNARLISDALSG